MKKIGIYGGTFDPIHHGHLILARDALEQFGLTRVIFVLAAHSPHKPQDEAAPAEQRWAMLLRAISGEPEFSASRLEIDRPAPSYSIDTVEQLRREQSEAEFFFLLGEDNLSRLPEWHRFEELRKLVQFIVFDRTGTQASCEYPAVQRRIEISATAIRNRVACGKSIRYLVPEAVEAIIRHENLYKGANRSHPRS